MSSLFMCRSFPSKPRRPRSTAVGVYSQPEETIFSQCENQRPQSSPSRLDGLFQPTRSHPSYHVLGLDIDRRHETWKPVRRITRIQFSLPYMLFAQALIGGEVLACDYRRCPPTSGTIPLCSRRSPSCCPRSVATRHGRATSCRHSSVIPT